jgi:hypothetical protein
VHAIQIACFGNARAAVTLSGAPVVNAERATQKCRRARKGSDAP